MGFTMDWFGQARNYVGLGLGVVIAMSTAADLAAQPARTRASQAPTSNVPTTKAPAAVGAAVNLEATAITLAPSDAAFFNTSLNMRQDWQQQVTNGWVAEVRRVPYVQQLEQFLQEQWDNPQPQAEQVKTFLSSPIVRDIAKLLGDMASRECFVYGEHNWCDFLQGFAALQYEMAQLTSSDEDAIREYVLDLEKADIDAIPIPTTIIGFQLSDDENARTQLDALEGVLQLALGNVEPLKPLLKGLRRKDLSNGQILSMTLAADQIPWQDIPAPDDKATEVIEHVADLLEGRKVVISLGVIANRLLISVSDTSDTLLNIGRNGADNLLANDALAPLMKSKPAELRGVTFASSDWRNSVWQSNFGNYFERLAMQLSNQIIADADEAEAEDLDKWQEELIEDCAWLDEKIAELMPEYADTLAYAFRSPAGTETLVYDWTPSWLLENAKPLEVTRHGGTGPLLLVASRQVWLEGGDEIVTGVLDALPKHVDQLIEAGVIEADAAEKVKEVVDGVIPILEDMFAALRDEVVPALDGNESLLAITALATASQLSEDAPTPPQPLPLPEIGVVMKLKDKEQFLSGCEEIVAGINALIDFAREQGAELPPNVRVPEPQEETLPGGGTRYSYPSNAPAPFDQFQLQMAIDAKVAVVGYSTRQVRDLYQERPLVARPAWYSPEKPTAAVGYVDIAGIFRAFKPWVHYGLTMSGQDLEEPLAPSRGGAPVPSGADILQIWDTFEKFGKSAGTTVIDQDDVTVSHWIWVGE